MEAVDAVRAVSLLLVGLYAGGVFFGVIAPSVHRLPGDAYIRYWQAENADYGRAMPILVLGGLFATVAAAVLSFEHRMAVGMLTVLGVVLLAATLVVTLVRLEPLNRLADAWDPARPPGSWHEARATWLRWHLVRTVLVVAAFAVLLVAQALDGPFA